MAARLTDAQKKQIIARYAECGNYSQVAREFHLSFTGVKKIVARDSESFKKCELKKQENTLDMFKYLDGQKGAVQKLLTNILDAMDDPAKLARANVRDLATAYGIIIDKATQTAPKETEELLQRARDILGGIDGVIR